MFTKLRNRIEKGEQGFTLIELLVVILIIGILAAIAIPSFLNQRVKGQDACAKSLARTMQTAAETYSTDNNGMYNSMTDVSLNGIENQISGTQCGGQINVGTTLTTGVCGTNEPATGANSYCVSTKSASGNFFSITRSSSGVIARGCYVPTGGNNGGCTGVASNVGSW